MLGFSCMQAAWQHSQFPRDKQMFSPPMTVVTREKVLFQRALFDKQKSEKKQMHSEYIFK